MPTDLCELLIGIHRDGHVDRSSLSSDDDTGMLGDDVEVVGELAISFFTRRAESLATCIGLHLNQY